MRTAATSVCAAFLAIVAAAPSALAGGVPEAPLDVRKTAEAKFVKPPTAAKNGAPSTSPSTSSGSRAESRDSGPGSVRIAFESSAATDAEVAVLDAKGKIVRHLAAGLLGKNAPEPFRKDSLAQEVLWDRRDDAGKAAVGGPFRVRVRLGTTAKLGRFLGHTPRKFYSIEAVTVGAGGELFVLSTEIFKYGRAELMVLDRNGAYLRTIMPYAANTPRERTESVGHLIVGEDRLPIVFNGQGLNLYPLVSGLRRQTMAWHPKGYLVAVSTPGTAREHGPPRHLIAFHPGGGAPEGVPFVGPRIFEARGFLGGGGERDALGMDRVAVSPDGEYVYLRQCFGSASHARWAHGVYRLKWTDEKLGEPWLGRKESGADDAHFNDPQGIAVDKQGRIYVCDRGNDRVMIFDKDGKLLGKFAAPTPEQIAVHPATGEIFVLSWVGGKKPPPGKLMHFGAWGAGAPKKIAELEMVGGRLMALDPESSPARVWVVARRNGDVLIPVTAARGKLEPGEEVGGGDGLQYPQFVVADQDRNRIMVKEMFGVSWTVFDLATGKSSDLPVKGADMGLDRDGNMYFLDGYGKSSISRYDPEGKHLPFPGIGSNRITDVKYRAYGGDMGLGGICVAANGDFFALLTGNYVTDGVGGRVTQFGPDGKVKKKDFIAALGYGDSGLGVDAAGNVYVGANLKPREQPFPKDFMDKVPAKRWLWWSNRGIWGGPPREIPWRYPFYNPYLFHWGSVFKFGPDGGTVHGHPNPRSNKGENPDSPFSSVENAPAGAAEYAPAYLGKRVMKVAGAEWSYLGYGTVPSSADGPTPDPGCVCNPSHFCVDGFGRVYVPDVLRFSVQVIDSAGNFIDRIGKYGNADSAGPGSKVPEPAIPFAWPNAVAATEDALYVVDTVNRRVVEVRLERAAAAECAAP